MQWVQYAKKSGMNIRKERDNNSKYEFREGKGI